MRQTGLLWKFFPPLLAIIVVSLVLTIGFAGRTLREFMMDKTTVELERVSTVLAPQLQPLVAAGDTLAIQKICRETGGRIDLRLTIIRDDGVVVGDSENTPGLLDNHGGRPEIITAFSGKTGSSLRFSTTQKHQRLYVAVPGGMETGTPFVVRASVSMAELARLQKTLYTEIAMVGLILAALAGLMSFLLARRISNALGRLQRGAEAFAHGDLDRRIRVGHSREMTAVAEDMNSMAEQLEERLGTVERQRNELEAVLSSMVEGVLAVDVDETVIRMNETASRMLGRDPAESLGRSIQEVGRNPQLTRMVQQCLVDPGPQVGDIHLGGSGDTLLKVQATGLIGPEKKQIGILLVMNDITRMHRLQTMRQDFVANVSHELKTPITSIKGFAETLLEESPGSFEEARRFIRIIDRQADRLGRIINDLLALSRLEKDGESGKMAREELCLGTVLQRILRDLGHRDPDRARRIDLHCPEDIRASLNAPLLEQAVGNLLDNALKYSPDSARIHIVCEQSTTATIIRVVDEGPGIEPEHQARLFERFYRVDKARSRQLGGTGLGLAIVKHIAQVHGGQAMVSSEPGRGSTFSLILPREVQA